MHKIVIAGLCLALAACQDNHVQEAQATTRCETLLAVQELASLPPGLRGDPRAPIRPKDAARINDGDRTIFIRRAYDRLVPDASGSRIEPRDYTCTVDKTSGKVASLMTNGHQQEFRLNDDEFAIMRNGKAGRR